MEPTFRLEVPVDITATQCSIVSPYSRYPSRPPVFRGIVACATPRYPEIMGICYCSCYGQCGLIDLLSITITRQCVIGVVENSGEVIPGVRGESCDAHTLAGGTVVYGYRHPVG